VILAVCRVSAQKPHGDDFQISCDACHTSESWTVITDSVSFDHDTTTFSLEGRHESVDCRQCHSTLEFAKAESNCTACHLDIHQQSVGDQCSRCHDSNSWFVNNITELHRQNSFPLQGAHATANCNACHKSDTDLRFDPLGTDCIGCHQQDFEATTNPDHAKAGFTTNCIECHKVDAFEWTGTGINHDFFPLTQGHDIDECARCHTGTDYSKVSPECITCHEGDYLASLNPNHQTINLSTSCAECHTTNEGWQPAKFEDHDAQYFPIYSGTHKGEWDDCVTCHTDPNNYAIFTCTTCHENPETDNQHDAVLGYSFSSSACIACHPNGENEGAFDHNNTNFPLTGSHTTVECLSCHANGFTGTPTACFACHTTDFEQSSNPDHEELGLSTDCVSCHSTAPDWNPATFAVHNDYYALNGAHAIIANDCASCHNGEYSNTPTTCIGCHTEDFNQTTEPSHTALSFSTDCITCHTEDSWSPATFDHNTIYVLAGAHAVIANQCAACHENGFENTPTTCIGCHQEDYNQTTTPSHVELQFSNECVNCHNETAWVPASFDHDNQYFPIYSGKHEGTWDNCTDCHTTPNDYSVFTCTTCHANPETDEQHNGISGYTYKSTACLACHPTGDADGAFDHNATEFPLTGAHTVVDCQSCHANGYEGTSTACQSCHTQDFNQSINPNHGSLGFSMECATCHTTEPGWRPATLDNHNDYYVLTGAHSDIANQCASCHNGDYNNTPNTCAGCHQQDYNQTVDPPHVELQFSTDCASCHTERGWIPATFNHDDEHFPIYSGAHDGQWDQCAACHTTPGDYALFTCVTCHANPETNDQHTGVNGYVYNSTACLACHPNGEANGGFDHSATGFPLTGAHTSINCLECHANGFEGTPTECQACHTPAFNQSTNPNHTALGFTNDCATCHTTAPDWNPATFDNHNEYYVLAGAHAVIADQCVTCHNGDYNNTPSTCVGCHQEDYNGTTNPSHLELNFSTECASCHTETDWSSAEYSNHDAEYFPIYSGTHEGVWDQCTECHTNTNNYAVFTCTTCHTNLETGDQHAGIGGYYYESNACLACHPMGESEGSFDHQTSGFPLTGGHENVDCASCHSGGYQNTPTECEACHMPEYNQSVNPNHTSLSIPTDCAMCHSTTPDWNPASFPIHDQYYVLAGAHAVIADQCVTCHNGDYNNTPNTCAGCHQDNYNQTTDPSHIALNFSTECASCHTETDWSGAEYSDHDVQYFPIYSGTHEGVWDQCTECHTNTNNYAIFTCTTCHTNQETADQHLGVGGYYYESSACLACHPMGESEGSFDHQTSGFPLTGGHENVDCASCHSGGYQNTPTECEACHMPDYNQSGNPNHITLAIPTDCAMCHSTTPDWNPASFPIHDQYYVLAGAHAVIADQCVTCHNGDYNNTPNTCVGCHQDDYNQTTDPSHITLNFSTECASCHTETDWSGAEYSDHDVQYFPIYSGTHDGVWDQCTECHTNTNNYAVFTCTTCHTNQETADQHIGVGGYYYESNACLACHPMGESDGSFDHQTSGFPLTGGHENVDCAACHSGGYQNTPTECNACHMPDYNQSSNPGHINLGLPTDCIMCHTTVPDWNPASFDIHDEYYVLEGAHAIIADQCITCHNGDYNNTPNTCVGCHQSDYNQTTNPSHISLNFSTECASCHTQTDWSPAEYSDHDDQYFPIYSGTHEGTWDQCTDCHTNTNNYAIFTCTTCHTPSETNQDHTGVGGYAYESNACLACHPTGESNGSFNHSSSFPLTQGHANVDCISCHSNGYENTPTECNACHMPDYNQSSNPGHINLGLPTDCIMCHTTVADWNPASFDIHDEYYVLEGAHAIIADQCITCHNGDYNNTPNTCVGCHQSDYNQTTNPSHTALNFSTECASCHTQSDWSPAEYSDHDDQYFPIYSGTHEGTWDQCTDCHTNTNNYAIFTCTTCHTPSETNQDHTGVGGYVYESNACLACHPTGESNGSFNHSSNFPLTEGHANVDCISCHSNGYENTPTECNACHTPDYNQSSNPNHLSLGLPTDCAMCHTTEPDWNPASFDIHNEYYVLAGAHAIIADQCITCHNGDYNNTPSTCVGCHQDDYNQTTNPSHTALNFSTECASCHTQSDWSPAEYNDHDDQFFPIYSGSHEGEWDQCTDCHTNTNNYAIFTCTTCHTASETNQEHTGVGGYIYESNACLACHPTGESDGSFNHNSSGFPLTQGHANVDCASCHSNGYENTPTECDACHMPDYTQSSNPSHTSLGLSTDCITCHTTNPNWDPALFPDHNDYYPLVGAHAAIANQCATCHNGNYNNTPNTCFGCHQDDYNQTNDPDHQAAQFPTTCETCHSQSAWEPATWDHDNLYFPIYSGEHEDEWDQCTDCHSNPNNYSIFTCLTCHQQGETNQDHQGVSGYQYNSNACLACHPEGEE